jgi:cyclohexyl-isocyanide hydratase
MDDEEVLLPIRKQMKSGRYVYAVCTGALICSAAGILQGRRTTTYWTAFDLLPYFGATPENSRMVEDGNPICAAGVSAGIGGPLKVVALF